MIKCLPFKKTVTVVLRPVNSRNFFSLNLLFRICISFVCCSLNSSYWSCSVFIPSLVQKATFLFENHNLNFSAEVWNACKTSSLTKSSLTTWKNFRNFQPYYAKHLKSFKMTGTNSRLLKFNKFLIITYANLQWLIFFLLQEERPVQTTVRNFFTENYT